MTGVLLNHAFKDAITKEIEVDAITKAAPALEDAVKENKLECDKKEKNNKRGALFKCK